MSLSILFVAVIVFVSLLLLVSLGFLARHCRPGAPSCPSCAHNVHGLAFPRCPECGGSLEEGVIGTDGTSIKRICLTTATLVVGMGLSLAVYGAMVDAWPRALQWMNVSYWVEQRGIAIEVEVDPSHLVRVQMSRTNQPGVMRIVEPKVSLLASDNEIASWQSDQTISGRTLAEIDFDGTSALETLRLLVPAKSESPFAALLHDVSRAKIFQEAIESWVCSGDTVEAYWPDGKGEKLFHGSVGRRISLQRVFVPAPALFELPIYLVPLAVFSVFVLAAYRVFWRNRTLVAFEPTLAT